MTVQQDHGRQTPYSNPGPHLDLVQALSTDPAALSAVARNVIVHYRASDYDLPETNRSDINARWLENILDLDQQRNAGPLAGPRNPINRVQGCCRDHTLFCVGTLRANGIAARSRVGFAGYFSDGWHHDHVVVEANIEGRWRRFDSEIENARPGLSSPMDLVFDSVDGRGFVTAAEVWSAHRRGEIDPETYGVDADVPVLRGERFLFNEVILETAHRFGDELLLWDSWGRMGPPEAPVDEADASWLDPIAELLLAADAGDGEAETRLVELYVADDGLRPGSTILQASPFGEPPVTVDLSDHSGRRLG